MEVSALNRPVQAADLPLEKLAGNPQLSEKEKVAEVSRQFEAVLLRQILTSAQKPHFRSTYSNDSMAGGIYRDLVTAQLADGISKSGALGFAAVFAKQMESGKTAGAQAESSATTAAGVRAPGVRGDSSSQISNTQKRWLHATPPKGAQHSVMHPLFNP